MAFEREHDPGMRRYPEVLEDFVELAGLMGQPLGKGTPRHPAMLRYRLGEAGVGEIIDEAQQDFRGNAGRIQAVEASASTSSMNNSEGFFQLWILRGRSLMSQATIAR